MLGGRRSEQSILMVSGLLGTVLMSNEIASDCAAAAHVAGLRYTTDAEPGMRRRRKGRGFTYLDRDGLPIRDAGELRRIR